MNLFYSALPHNRYYAWFQALHTRIDILLSAALSKEQFEASEAAIRAELKAVELMGNRFDPNSELSQMVTAANTAASASYTTSASSVLSGFPAQSPSPSPSALLSPALFALLSRCLQAHRDTNGLFDITVNSPHFRPGLIQSVELLPSGDSGYLHFHRPDIILDLSGILKGYALERLRQLLPTLGINDALINLGNSSILSLGHNPSDIPSGYCLTTSGNATADRRHIRNPLTGEFVTGQRQESVITVDAIEGEILSTVNFIRSAIHQ